jgi:pimeloyl-ACP methyl ester carboxylesterase
MATATIDGLKVEYVTRGSGPALLMLAPGGFDASMDKWRSGTAWKGMDALDALARAFTVVVYDRREAGVSGGRVERLSWAL